MINGVENNFYFYFLTTIFFYPKQVLLHFAFFDSLLKSNSNATSKLESPHYVIGTQKSLVWSEEEINKFNEYSK